VTLREATFFNRWSGADGKNPIRSTACRWGLKN
jgi:hypothetical protein